MGKTYCRPTIILALCALGGVFVLQAGDGGLSRRAERVLILCPGCYPAAKARIDQQGKTILKLERENQALKIEKHRLQSRFADGVLLGTIVGVFAALYFAGDSGS